MASQCPNQSGLEAPAAAGKVRRSQKEISRQLRKTKMCTYYLKGACPFAEECAFAHTLGELKAQPNLKKTRICKFWMKASCIDDKCNFAHGPEELNTPVGEPRQHQALAGKHQAQRLAGIEWERQHSPELEKMPSRGSSCGSVELPAAAPASMHLSGMAPAARLDLSGLPPPPRTLLDRSTFRASNLPMPDYYRPASPESNPPMPDLYRTTSPESNLPMPDFYRTTSPDFFDQNQVMPVTAHLNSKNDATLNMKDMTDCILQERALGDGKLLQSKMMQSSWNSVQASNIPVGYQRSSFESTPHGEAQDVAANVHLLANTLRELTVRCTRLSHQLGINGANQQQKVILPPPGLADFQPGRVA